MDPKTTRTKIASSSTTLFCGQLHHGIFLANPWDGAAAATPSQLISSFILYLICCFRIKFYKSRKGAM
jgi:hypothetical protein